MRRRFVWSNLARQQIRSIDQVSAMQIQRKLDRFELTGIGDVKKLIDIEPPEFRLRHGDFRVRFYATGKTIQIISVTNRNRSYRS